jgi:hypothetical protein
LNPSKKQLYHCFQHFLFQNGDVPSTAHARGDRNIPLLLHLDDLDVVMGQIYLFAYIEETFPEIKELFFRITG